MISLNKAVAVVLLIIPSFSQAEQVDPQTGLIIDQGFDTVKKQCTVCHSAKLIVQNRATRQGWMETIRWMQETQGLQQLDQDTEQEILNYLATHYVPEAQGRRSPLVIDQWRPYKAN